MLCYRCHLFHILPHTSADIQQQQQRQRFLLTAKVDNRLRTVILANDEILRREAGDQFTILGDLRVHSDIGYGGLERDIAFLREHWAY